MESSSRVRSPGRSRAHGWQRAGRRIRERMEACLGQNEAHDEDGAIFIWTPGAYAPSIPFRAGIDRSPRDISRSEVLGLISEHPDLAARKDAARDLARLMGIGRLSEDARAYLKSCLLKAGVVSPDTNFDKTDLTPLPTTGSKSQIDTPIVREEERELKQRYINHVIIEAPKILAEHGGSLEKSEMREALRMRFPGELPLGEGNAYGWGFRILSETGVIEPTSKSKTYELKDRKPR